ncbi:MAG: M20/M25/M40 family metallo-hydrolase, partial [Chloroflexota bacterium]|nr:M20/M25/M40 family metallo-hydrolase [Chloroflexota bacterium]
GVSDNKGNIVARLLAIKAFREVRGHLPVSVKFCIEGEEEIGSRNLPAFVEGHKDLLKADTCLWEGGGVNWKGQPTIYLGVKGILYVELEARTVVRDLHSSWGTVVPNAAWRLVWALNTLKDAQENILIPGFYQDIRPPTPQEVQAVKAMPQEEKEVGESLGLKQFLKNLSGSALQQRHLLEPTCTICGIISGYTGEGSKTVLPCLARAKVDFRLVPDQRPEDIMAKLRRHLDKHGFSDIVITTPMEGENPARTPLDHPFVKLVVEGAREVYGLEPVVSPTMAGTGPLFPFTEVLGLPVASAGVEYPDCRIHAPDEHIRVDDFLHGVKHIAAIMERLGHNQP